MPASDLPLTRFNFRIARLVETAPETLLARTGEPHEGFMYALAAAPQRLDLSTDDPSARNHVGWMLDALDSGVVRRQARLALSNASIAGRPVEFRRRNYRPGLSDWAAGRQRVTALTDDNLGAGVLNELSWKAVVDYHLPKALGPHLPLKDRDPYSNQTTFRWLAENALDVLSPMKTALVMAFRQIKTCDQVLAASAELLTARTAGAATMPMVAWQALLAPKGTMGPILAWHTRERTVEAIDRLLEASPVPSMETGRAAQAIAVAEFSKVNKRNASAGQRYLMQLFEVSDWGGFGAALARIDETLGRSFERTNENRTRYCYVPANHSFVCFTRLAHDAGNIKVQGAWNLAEASAMSDGNFLTAGRVRPVMSAQDVLTGLAAGTLHDFGETSNVETFLDPEQQTQLRKLHNLPEPSRLHCQIGTEELAEFREQHRAHVFARKDGTAYYLPAESDALHVARIVSTGKKTAAYSLQKIGIGPLDVACLAERVRLGECIDLGRVRVTDKFELPKEAKPMLELFLGPNKFESASVSISPDR